MALALAKLALARNTMPSDATMATGKAVKSPSRIPPAGQPLSPSCLGALGAGNMPGVVTYHAGIRGDADAPKPWNWNVATPVAEVTIGLLEASL
jgi:hypothetical protein